MGIAAMGAQAAGAGMNAIGSYYGAKSQQESLRAAANIADINAGMAEHAAQIELLRGNEAAASVSARAGQVKGAQRAAMAANGIDLGVGNAAEVLTSTDIGKEQDMNAVTANAVQAAWGQRMNATNYKNEALTKRAGADSISPFMAAASSLLGSSSQIASSWYMMNKAGVPGTTTGVAPKGT